MITDALLPAKKRRTDESPNRKIEIMREYVCDGCSEPIGRKQRYCLRLELYAAPEIEFSAEDLRRDHRRELRKLYEEAAKQDARKLEEEVYVRYERQLCKKCRDRFARRVQCREFV